MIFNVTMVILQMTLQKLLEWAHLDLNLTKCAITRSPNPNVFKAYIQTQNILFKNKPFPTLSQNNAYTYQGIHLAPHSNGNCKKNILIKKQKSKQLMTSLATIRYSP